MDEYKEIKKHLEALEEYKFKTVTGGYLDIKTFSTLDCKNVYLFIMDWVTKFIAENRTFELMSQLENNKGIKYLGERVING
jgi:hypothetical protein